LREREQEQAQTGGEGEGKADSLLSGAGFQDPEIMTSVRHLTD